MLRRLAELCTILLTSLGRSRLMHINMSCSSPQAQLCFWITCLLTGCLKDCRTAMRCQPGAGSFLPCPYAALWWCRCRQIQDICPDWLPGKWLKVFSQNWEGDVTMVLPSSYLQIKKAITNPSKEDLLQASRQVLTVLKFCWLESLDLARSYPTQSTNILAEPGLQ